MTRPAQPPLPAPVNPLYPAGTPPQAEDVRRAHAEAEKRKLVEKLIAKLKENHGHPTDNQH